VKKTKRRYWPGNRTSLRYIHGAPLIGEGTRKTQAGKRARPHQACGTIQSGRPSRPRAGKKTKKVKKKNGDGDITQSSPATLIFQSHSIELLGGAFNHEADVPIQPGKQKGGTQTTKALRQDQ